MIKREMKIIHYNSGENTTYICHPSHLATLEGSNAYAVDAYTIYEYIIYGFLSHRFLINACTNSSKSWVCWCLCLHMMLPYLYDSPCPPSPWAPLDLHRRLPRRVRGCFSQLHYNRTTMPPRRMRVHEMSIYICTFRKNFLLTSMVYS